MLRAPKKMHLKFHRFVLPAHRRETIHRRVPKLIGRCSMFGRWPFVNWHALLFIGERFTISELQMPCSDYNDFTDAFISVRSLSMTPSPFSPSFPLNHQSLELLNHWTPMMWFNAVVRPYRLDHIEAKDSLTEIWNLSPWTVEPWTIEPLNFWEKGSSGWFNDTEQQFTFWDTLDISNRLNFEPLNPTIEYERMVQWYIIYTSSKVQTLSNLANK